MKVESERFSDGVAILGDSTALEMRAVVGTLVGEDRFPLIIADPPYGNIVNEDWDRRPWNAKELTDWMLGWTNRWSLSLYEGAAFYVWGGVGRPGFRPFFQYLSRLEDESPMRLANLITWSKRRAYGVQHNYLFTREECAYLINNLDIKKPRCFNVPLLSERRGYAGYNKKYPARSEFKRRTNVWTDITELMRGKVHRTQKPLRVMEVPIEVHTQPGEWVIDLFAGSGVTGHAARRLGRRFVLIENDEDTYRNMVERLRKTDEAGNS